MSNTEGNPFMALDATAIDVLDDMMSAWGDKDRHAELERDYAYGPEKFEAFYALSNQVRDAWNQRVGFADPEDVE